MNGRRILLVVLVGGVAFWLVRSGRLQKGTAAPDAAPAAGGTAPGAAAYACLTTAEEAGRATHEAAMVLLRTPVDPAAFSEASGRASSAISAAEGRCSGGTSPGEQKAIEEARGALAEMRALLSDVSSTLAGGGSASELPRRQETIDVKLAAAKAALQG